MVAGSVTARDSITVPVGQARAIGVQMSHLQGDNVPYRVKCYVSDGAALIVGWANASTTGIDDDINNAIYLPFIYRFDDIVMVPVPPPGFENRPVIFAVATTAEKSQATPVMAHLSVQTTGLKAPTMQYSIP